MTDTSLQALRPNPRNPRRVTDKKLEMLKASLAEFGDLSGIVVNQTSGQQLVGGHQRLKAFQDIGAEHFTIERTYAKPTPAGTVAEGYVMVDGERHAYREVIWDEAKEKAANLAANKGAGEWDLSGVAAWVEDLAACEFDLDLTMFDELERLNLQPPQAAGDEWDDALDKLPEGEQGGLKTVTFTLSAEQHRVVMAQVEAMKQLGPFVDTGNDNANGNALARLAELYRG